MSKPRSTVHKYTHEPSRTESMDIYPDEIRQLAASIVLRAVSDWIDLILAEDRDKGAAEPKPEPGKRQYKQRRRDCAKPSYDEIREFFDSDYGDFICSFIDMDSEVILGRMENWLFVYRTKGIKPTKLTATRWG